MKDSNSGKNLLNFSTAHCKRVVTRGSDWTGVSNTLQHGRPLYSAANLLLCIAQTNTSLSISHVETHRVSNTNRWTSSVYCRFDALNSSARTTFSRWSDAKQRSLLVSSLKNFCRTFSHVFLQKVVYNRAFLVDFHRSDITWLDVVFQNILNTLDENVIVNWSRRLQRSDPLDATERSVQYLKHFCWNIFMSLRHQHSCSSLQWRSFQSHIVF